MEPTKTNSFDKFESIFKIATPIGAMIAFFIGIYHYRDSQAEEFKKTYWEKRYATYESVSHLSAQLANVSDKDEWDYLKKQFWTMYYGETVLVEDLHVYDAMKSFGDSLQRALYPDSLHVLTIKAHALSHACRTSLKETWEPVPVSEIKTLDH